MPIKNFEKDFSNHRKKLIGYNDVGLLSQSKYIK